MRSFATCNPHRTVFLAWHSPVIKNYNPMIPFAPYSPTTLYTPLCFDISCSACLQIIASCWKTRKSLV